ncbi:hypothetical protein [Devosia sp.]|jgi:hypothetical protein|uniref:hypothetical protein n=1 Tax=Devosia sp. TaxID=1871048 RepID=UPI0037BF3CF4
MTPPDPKRDAEIAKRRRKRSIALALVLGGLVLIFYVLTIVKMGPAVFDRAI